MLNKYQKTEVVLIYDGNASVKIYPLQAYLYIRLQRIVLSFYINTSKMPKVKCPIPACTFETEHLDPATVAALITTHAKVHENTAKVEKVKPPTMSSADTSK